MSDKTIAIKDNFGDSLKKILKRREVLTLYIVLAIWLALSFINKNYASLNNLGSIMKTLSFFGIIAVGLSLVFIQGDMDISIGAGAGFAAVFGTAFMLNTRCMGMQDTSLEWLGLVLCIMVTMIVGSLIGAVNATMVARLNLPGFIATIAMKYLLDGGVMIVTGGSYVYPLPKQFIAFGKLGIPMGNNDISIFFLIMILLMVIVHLMLNFTTYGRSVYATGSNRIAAQLAGIKTNRVRYTNYMILHALVALSGVLNASFVAQGSPNIGTDWELLIIASCAIGGVKMGGGSGNMVGLLIGTFALFSINSAIAFIGINTFLQDVVIGGIFIIIFVTDMFREQRKIIA